MKLIDCLEEIVMAYSLCEKNECEHCLYEDACNSVFGKKFVIDEIHELASQCKAFNEFARANRKG